MILTLEYRADPEHSEHLNDHTIWETMVKRSWWVPRMPVGRLGRLNRAGWAGCLAILIGFSGATAEAATVSTTTSLTIGPSGAVAQGTVESLTASVTAGGSVVSGGTLYFCDATATSCADAAILATAQVTTAGTATAKMRLGPGSYSIKAVYRGINAYTGSSSSSQSLTVTSALSSSLAISAQNGADGYTLVGTLSSGGKAVPAGSVSFLDTSAANATLGSSSLTTASVAGGFQSEVGYTTDAQSSASVHVLAVGDWNNDGYPDVAVANSGTNTVSVFLGKADRSFQAQVEYTVGSSPYGIAAGDVNNDGNLDLVVTSLDGGTVGVLLGNGDGTFQSQVTYAAGSDPKGVALGDFNGDGYLDIAVADYTYNSSPNLRVFLNNGDGTFAASTNYNAGDDWPQSVSVADVNGDGILDLVTGNYALGSLSNAGVLLGKGDGTFQSAKVYLTGASYSGLKSATVADVNGDGYPDILAANFGSNTVGVLLNNGDGTYASVVEYGTDSRPSSVAVADVTGDGKLDLIVGSDNTTTPLRVFPGKGDGTFQTAISYPIGNNNTTVAVADLNGDGIADILAVSTTASTLEVAYGQLTRTQTATATGVAPQGSGTHQIEASYPGDGNYTATASSTIALSADLVPTSLTLQYAPASPVQQGVAVTLTASLTPASSGTLIASGTVSFHDGSVLLGQATLSSGQASFVASALTVGEHSLTVVYSGDSNFRGSNSAAQTITVTTPVVTPVLTITPGTPVTTGRPVTLSATVTYGGTTLTAGTVHFCNAAAKSCAGAGLLGTAQITAAGTASSVVRLGAGGYTLVADFLGAGVYGEALSASQTLTVTANPQLTSASAIASSGAAGAYTLTGTLSSTGSAAPSGNILFLDSSNGNNTLSSGSMVAATVAQSFAGSVAYSAGNYPVGVVAADLNNDGIPDLIVPDQNDSVISILLGNGDGTFSSATTVSTGSGPTAVVVGDFNADGKVDLAVGNEYDSDIAILLGNGDGTFQAQTSLSASGNVSFSLVAGDFNHDGKLDLASANGGSMYVYLGNGDGTFQSSVQYSMTGGSGGAVVAGDFNGDGYLDIATMTEGSPGYLNVFLNKADGTGAFNSEVSYAGGNSSNNNIVNGKLLAMTDLNGDGNLDLAMVNRQDWSVSIFLGKGDGTFTSGSVLNTSSNGGGYQPINIAAGDVNGDGNQDLVVANRSNQTISVFLGNGDGTMQNATGYATGLNFITGVSLADLNGDGIMDAVVSGSSSSNVGVQLGQLTRTQTVSVGPLAQPGSGTHNIYANFAGDTNYSSSSSSPVALTGSLLTPTVALTSTLASSVYGQSVMLTTALSPATSDGYVPSGNVTFYDNGVAIGSTALSAAQTSLTTATLSVGTHAITVTYAGDSNFATNTSSSVTVQVGQATTTVKGTTVTTTYGVAGASTITLAGQNSGAGIATPSGSVAYTLDSVAAGTATLSGGQTVFVIPATTAAGAHTVGISYAGDTNYAASTATVAVTVKQAVPTILWPSPATIAYGTALSATQLSASATGVTGNTLGGTYTYAPAVGTVLSAGTQTLSVTFTPIDATNYSTTTATAQLTVTAASPSITWATPTAISYGIPLSAVQLNATSTVAGAMTYSPAVGRILGAGTQTLSVTFTPTDAADYQVSVSTVSLVVNPVALTITANAANRAYGAANPAFTGTITGAQEGDTLTPTYTTSANSTSVPATYTIVPSISGASTANYTVTANNGVLTVTKAAPAVSLSLNSASTIVATAISMTSKVSASFSGTPTGTVTFLDGTTALATETLDATGSATYTTSTLVVGSHSLTAVYSGDTDFTSVTSSAAAEAVEDFQLTTSTATQAVKPGGSATFDFTLAPSVGSFDSAVTFAVTGLPSGYSWTASPSSVTPGSSSSQVTLTVTAPAASAAMREIGGTAPLALALLVLPLFGVRRFRKLLSTPMQVVLLLALSLGAATTLMGCGGHSSSSTTTQSYTITVTATSGTAQHSSTVTLNVE